MPRKFAPTNRKIGLSWNKLFLLFSFHFLFITLSAQSPRIEKSEDTLQATTIVTAGKEYDRSSYHNFFWGKHYRKEWTTQVRIKNFYLDTAKGGLKATQESGSRQSMGLRLEDKNGKQYVLRSVDKDFGNGLPEIFRGTFMSRIAKDQASIGYPYAAITITPMIDAAGIYHSNPEIVYVPEQKSLGDYNKKYANKLYLFEERPDDNNEEDVNFGNAQKIIGSEKLYEHLYEDNDYSVDQKAFAKARLFDMFIGDWGRHADQWRWATFKEDKKTIYKPIPRDRDQAYTKFDGFFPFIATNIAGAKHLESFNYKIKKVADFNLPARQLDKQFTNQLTEHQWIGIAKELQEALTDSVIKYGMHQLAPEIFAINGEKIISLLKSRRDYLQEFARDYYKFLAKRVYIPGSDKKELFEIDRLNDNETKINVYKISDKNESKELLYSRTFTSRESAEVFLYGFKGKDVFYLTGNSSDGVKIRIIDVTKSDSVINNNSFGDRKTKIYKGENGESDTIQQARLHVGPIIFVVPSIYNVFDNDPLQLFTRTGLRVGINIDYHIKPWRKDDLECRQMLSVNYGFLRKAFNVQYIGLFPQVVGKSDLIFKARYNGPAIENFFGTGNESKIINDASYYTTKSTRWYGGVGLSKDFAKFNHAEITIFYQNIDIENTPGHFITAPDRNIDLSSKQFTGIEAGYNFRKTNNDKYPTAGIDFSVGTGYVHDLTATDHSFYKINSALAFYIPFGNSFSLAVRAGGGHVEGNAAYYHLNKLSGNTNLRGFARDRFYGKTSFYNNNELRWIINTHNYFFNGKIGLLAFTDNGRIWQPLEDSRTWHTGYGGGLILIPFNKLVLTGTYGLSNEGNHIVVKGGLFF